MRTRIAGVALLALGAWWWIGCASGLSAPGKETRERIERLQERVVELQRQAAVNEVEIARLREKVAALEAAPAGGRAAEAGATTGEKRRSDRSVVLVEPVEEEAIDAPPVPSSRKAEAETEVGERRGSGTDPGDEDRISGPTEAEPPAPGVADRPLGASAQAIYDEAYTLYHQGRYQEAEEAFHRFLEENPRTELSDNAQYWIGAARFAREDHAGALRAFRETVERYPEANKVPDALYKVGQSLEAIGDLEAAREVYEDLESRFPTTAAASLASDRLEDLR